MSAARQQGTGSKARQGCEVEPCPTSASQEAIDQHSQQQAKTTEQEGPQLQQQPSHNQGHGALTEPSFWILKTAQHLGTRSRHGWVVTVPYEAVA
jgi:hypothetical protein